MSIINEALKKAQGERRQEVTKEAPKPLGKMEEMPDATLRRLRGDKKHILPIFFVVIFIIVVTGVIFVKKHPFAIHPKRVTSDMPLRVQERSNQLIPSPSSFPILELNGIVYDEEKPYAIVNDKVLLQGDVIEGATLIEIKHDRVKFVFKGEEFELTAK